VGLGDLTCHVKSQAEPAVVASGGRPFKPLEDARKVGLRDSRTVVADLEHRRMVVPRYRHAYLIEFESRFVRP
jgi:hypothetical protein